MIGKQISPILTEIESALWEYEDKVGIKTNYSCDALRSACKIFMSVLMDKMWELQEAEKMDFKSREDMAQKAGESVRNLVKTYCNVETHNFYK